MTKLLLIFIGGGCGSVLRYLISSASAGLNPSLSFPVGTLVCNVIGCFLIGLFNALSAQFGWSNETRLMLTVGLCGGFTTFSTFSNEGLSMLNAGSYLSYALYVALSIILGIGAVVLGMSVMHNS